MTETLGIDPTATQIMGWAAIEDGGLLAFGSVPMSEAPMLSWYESASDAIRRIAFQSWSLANLIASRRPDLVAIEEPITNSAAAAHYLEAAATSGAAAGLTPRLTGAVSSSIKVGLAVGSLIHVCLDARMPVLLLNPGTAKALACGSVHATKATVREAARLRVYEMLYTQAIARAEQPPDHNDVKAPSEHIAAAIFIGLAADYQRKVGQAMRGAA